VDDERNYVCSSAVFNFQAELNLTVMTRDYTVPLQCASFQRPVANAIEVFGAFGEIDSGIRTTVRIMLLVVLRVLDGSAYVCESSVCCLSTKYARFSGPLSKSDVKLSYLSLSHSDEKLGI
jgi:hypothetical protein